MLTGDSRTTADAVASKLGMDEVAADVLPNEKAEDHETLSGSGQKKSRWQVMASTTSGLA